MEANFLPELLGRTKTDWATACCGAEDMSSRAGFSSCASTFERVHTRCAEINEFQAETTEFDLIIVVTVTAVVIISLRPFHCNQGRFHCNQV